MYQQFYYIESYNIIVFTTNFDRFSTLSLYLSTYLKTSEQSEELWELITLYVYFPTIMNGHADRHLEKSQKYEQP